MKLRCTSSGAVPRGRHSRLLTLLAIPLLVTAPVSAQDERPYNIVVILSDDQRWDTLWAMPELQEKVIARGITFTNAIVASPICCPARASFLSGGFYPHHTGVLTNGLPNGGVTRFRDEDTLATRLQSRGYRTAMIGKYMNGYFETHVAGRPRPYVPPGWSRFVRAAGGSDWISYQAVVGSSDATKPSEGTKLKVEQYLTDFLRDQALAFVGEGSGEPFFLYLAPFAPHPPAIPAPEDRALFSGYLYRGRAYREEDRSDKPAHGQRIAERFVPAVADEFQRNQLRSLQAVDRAVGALVDELERLGKLDRTVLFYTSDNGFLWGEHGLTGKDKPYEESIRVPLVVAMPGLPAREHGFFVASNLDVPATILELAGDPLHAASDGVSLLPLLQDPQAFRGEAVLIQSFRRVGPPSQMLLIPWAGFRSGQRYKYIEYATGEEELYDLLADPFELDNLAARPDLDAIVTGEGLTLAEKKDQLAAWVRDRRGLAITVTEASPVGEVGEPYVFQPTAWGGQPPYRWSWSAAEESSLPPGLTIDALSGRVSGTPLRGGIYAADLRVQDSSVASHTGAPQTFVASSLEFRVEPVPEPGAAGLAAGCGLLALLGARRHARRRSLLTARGCGGEDRPASS